MEPICKYCPNKFTVDNPAMPLGNVQDVNCEFVHRDCYPEYIKSKSNENILLKDIEATFSICLEIAKRKNNDYAGEKTKDPFKNLKGSLFVGVPVERAILVRMMDKMSRVSNLLSQGNAVKDESIEDTLRDMINYSAILLSFIKNNK